MVYTGSREIVFHMVWKITNNFVFLPNALWSLVTTAEGPTYQLKIVRGCSVWTASPFTALRFAADSTASLLTQFGGIVFLIKCLPRLFFQLRLHMTSVTARTYKILVRIICSRQCRNSRNSLILGDWLNTLFPMLKDNFFSRGVWFNAKIV